MTKITFNKKKHIYKLDGKPATSVTKWIGQFMSEFDAKAIARMLAKFPANKANKRGVRYWLKQWKEDADHGTRVHDLIERFCLDWCRVDYQEINRDRDMNKFVQAMNFFNNTNFEGFDFMVPEERVGDAELGLAGTVDLVVYNKDNSVTLVDWKTNKSISKTGRDGKMCKRPISHLPDCSYTKYMLQLSTYAYIKERQGYDIKKLMLVHLMEDKYKVYEIPYEKVLVQEMLEWMNQQKN